MTTTKTPTKISPIQNGFWTVLDSKTGEHRTFRIWTETWEDKRSKHSTKPLPPKKVRVIGLLTDSSNTSDYTNFGTVSDDGKKIWVWRRFKREQGGRMTKHELYGWLFEDLKVKDGERWGERFTLEGSGNCCRCNRLLTHPQSLLTGYGPVCLMK